MKPLSKIYTNTNYPLTLIYKDADGAPIDITGGTGTFVVKRTLYSDPIISVAGTVNGLAGEVTFNVPPEATVDILDNVDSEKFQCGVVLTLDGERIPLLQTTVDIVRSVIPE